MMNLAEFRASLSQDAPPDNLSLALQSLWYDANGAWEKAHTLAQGQEDADGAWVHAYLHRVEGDLSNAGYWYRRANRPPASLPLPEEWDAIAAELLDRT
jgi:hypothetical protein